ncbi:MAG: MATE family efflux transporter [Candidatus Eisenbacteria bacterium]
MEQEPVTTTEPEGAAPAGVIRSGRLAGRSLTSAILVLALPVFLDQLLSATVGLVDKILTGALPAAATASLDGVGTGSYVGWFLGIAISSVGIGSLAIIARALGRGDVREADHGLGQALVAAVGWGVLLFVLLQTGAPLLARVSSLSPEASDACIVYVRAMSFGAPFFSVLLVGIMSLHGAGEAVRPFLVMLFVNTVNIVTSWLLSGSIVHVFGQTLVSPGHLGVQGIGLGTAIGHATGAIAILILLARGVKDLRLQRWALRPEGPMMSRIIRVGTPAFLDGMGMWSGNIIVIGIVGKIALQEAAHSDAIAGATKVGLIGAHIIGVQWEALSFLPGFAMGTAAAALVGQFLGAGNPRMATRAALACFGIAAIFMASAGVVFFFGGEFLTRQISRAPLHLAVVPKLLKICAVVQINFGLAMVMREALRGAGDTRWAMAINWFSTYALRVPFVYWVGYHLGHGLVGVWFVLCGEIVARSLLYLARFWQGGWKRIEV